MDKKQSLYARLLLKLRTLSAPQVIVLVFFTIILLGAVLLCLPISNRSGHWGSLLTGLFTATSATCVTGLSLVDTYTNWTSFGQSVILVLIQIGGLGFMSIVSVFFWVLRSRIGLRNRMLMSQSMGLDGVEGVVRLLHHVIIGTAFFELTGAIILAARFSMDMPLMQALRWGLFHSVSAFCNAGFDIMGKLAPGSSLAPYGNDPVVLITIMFLIVIGGLGFVVWEDLRTNRRWRRLTVYTKLVLLISAILLVGGAIAWGALEWQNPNTIGQMTTGDKLLTCAFQSTTTRTAGFTTFDQGAMTESGKILTSVLMLIGGSSGSTAGGVKTVTVGIAVLGAFSVLCGKKRLTVFKRTIDAGQILVAFSILFMMVLLSIVGAIYLSVGCQLPFLDALYETISAIGTVGLTAGGTAALDTVGKLMIIVFMFFGRIGIMTIGVGFLLGDKEEGRYRYSTAKLLIG